MGKGRTQRARRPSPRAVLRLAPLILLAIGAGTLAPPAMADQPLAAEHSPGRAAFLDPSFGEAGRAMLPPQPFASYADAVLMHDDGLVVATDRGLRRLGPGGWLDEAFGAGGTVTPPAPPGGEFELEALGVDSRNRLIVAGTASLPGEEPPSPDSFGNGIGERPKRARVLRYLPSGVLDPGFGEGGVVETDLGLPAPREEEGTQILSRPWVEVTGVAIDSQDRVVLTGGASAGLEGGCAHDWFFDTLTYAAFVARLDPAGRLDSTFGRGGVFGGRSTAENPLRAEVAADPALGPGDEVTYASGVGHCPRAAGASGLGRLDAGGGTEVGFGTRGAVRRWSDDMVALSGGGIATLGYETPWYNTKEAATVGVTRLSPEGRRDRSFGTRGKTVIRTPGGSGGLLGSIAADWRGACCSAAR
ncbi:MAG TPA: hypothetical protein VF125_03055 [Solirubrobacterales bacterium]